MGTELNYERNIRIKVLWRKNLKRWPVNIFQWNRSTVCLQQHKSRI